MTLRVLWVHNNASPAAGTFMWDQFAAFREIPEVSIEEFFVPVQPRLRDLPGLLRRLRQKSGEFDLVHCQYGSFVGLCALASLRPVVISLRGSDIYGLGATTFRNLIPAAVRILFSYLGAAWSSQIIVMSEAMRRKVSRVLFWRKYSIHVICDPASIDVWKRHLPALASAAPQDLQARIVFASAQDKNPIKRAWLVSGGADLARRAGVDVTLDILTGMPRQAVYAAVAAADAVALASTHEGWPNIIKEGLLLGKGFIATRVSDLDRFADGAAFRVLCDASAAAFGLSMVDLAYWNILKQCGLEETRLLPFFPGNSARKTLLVYHLALK